MKTKLLLLLSFLGINYGFSQNYFIPQYNANKDTVSKADKELIEKIDSLTTLTNAAIKVKKTNEINAFSQGKNITTPDASIQTLSQINDYKFTDSDPIINTENEKQIVALLSKKTVTETINSFKTIKDLNDYKRSNIAVLKDYTDEEYELFNTKQKSLKVENTNKYLLTEKRKTKLFKIWDSNEYDADTFNSFFNKNVGLSAFTNVSLQSFSDATYLNAELISFYFNYIRLGVSGGLKATNNATTDADAVTQELTKMLHNGGSLNFNFSLPIYYKRTRLDHIHWGLFAETSVGLTPNFKTDVSTDKVDGSTDNTDAYISNDLLVNNQFGFNIKLDISSNETDIKKQARFFIEIPVHYIYGNKQSYQLLNITDNTTARINIGAILGDKLSFRVSGPLYSTTDSIMKTPFLFSLDFSPK